MIASKLGLHIMRTYFFAHPYMPFLSFATFLKARGPKSEEAAGREKEHKRGGRWFGRKMEDIPLDGLQRSCNEKKDFSKKWKTTFLGTFHKHQKSNFSIM